MNFIKNTISLILMILEFLLYLFSIIALFVLCCYVLELGGIISGIITLLYMSFISDKWDFINIV